MKSPRLIFSSAGLTEIALHCKKQQNLAIPDGSYEVCSVGGPAIASDIQRAYSLPGTRTRVVFELKCFGAGHLLLTLHPSPSTARRWLNLIGHTINLLIQ